MKRIFILVALCCSYYCDAQNYECLQAGAKHYFTNSKGYLRGIRIDSVRSYADSVVYFPFHTPRGRYGWSFHSVMDTAKGSWLGKRVMQQNDGTFLFDNIWNDTVVIKTQAHKGDTWVFYNDTTKLYYQAELIAEDTMTVLGVVDSVKKILITARDPTGIVTTDPVDSFSIIIGKNSGFVQVFDLYTFPFHAPDSAYHSGFDYFLDEITGGAKPTPINSIFSLARFTHPTQTQMYNWDAGDVYETRNCVSDTYADCPYPAKYSYDSIVSKTITADSVQYTIEGWVAVQQYKFTYVYNTPYPYARMTTNRSFTIPNVHFFDTSLMPEEHKQPYLFTYYPEDTSYCMRADRFVTNPSSIPDSVWVNIHFESGGPTYSYIKGLGLVDYYKYEIGNPTEETRTEKMIYYRRGGVPCGSYVGPTALSIDEAISSPGTIKLFPNPATNELTISSTEKITGIAISNLLGQTVYTGSYQAEKVNVDIRGLCAGVYFVKINGVEVRKFVKE